MAHRLSKSFDLALVVREEKALDEFYRGHQDEALIVDHFARLRSTEDLFFHGDSWDSFNGRSLTRERGKLNNSEVAAMISDANPDAVVVFGCGILKEPVMSALPRMRTFNLHQGLSPYYRGSGTNFWPYVERRPQYIGATVHLIDDDVDTGNIVSHARPVMDPSDTLHTLGCKTVVASAGCIEKILRHVERGDQMPVRQQWMPGKVYRRADMTGAAVIEARKLDDEGFIATFLRDQAGIEQPALVEASA